jgi:hypothetical protein
MPSLGDVLYPGLALGCLGHSGLAVSFLGEAGNWVAFRVNESLRWLLGGNQNFPFLPIAVPYFRKLSS